MALIRNAHAGLTGRPGLSWAQVCLVAVLAGVAGGVVARLMPSAGPSVALAQPVQAAQSPGVFAVAGQVGRDSYGLYLVDVAGETLLVYEYDASRRQLGLRAARTFRFDRRLEAYNTEPDPAEIAEMVRQARPISGQ